MAVRRGRGPEGRGAGLREARAADVVRLARNAPSLYFSLDLDRQCEERELQCKREGERRPGTETARRASTTERAPAHHSPSTASTREGEDQLPSSAHAGTRRERETHSAAACRRRRWPPSAPSCACRRSGNLSTCTGRPASAMGSRYQRCLAERLETKSKDARDAPGGASPGSAGTGSTASRTPSRRSRRASPAGGAARPCEGGSCGRRLGLRASEGGRRGQCAPAEGVRARQGRTWRARLERRFAPEAGHRLDGELHEAADGRRDDRDGARVVAGDCVRGRELKVSSARRRSESDERKQDARRELARSPMMGSKMRMSGFESWFSR